MAPTLAHPTTPKPSINLDTPRKYSPRSRRGPASVLRIPHKYTRKGASHTRGASTLAWARRVLARPCAPTGGSGPLWGRRVYSLRSRRGPASVLRIPRKYSPRFPDAQPLPHPPNRRLNKKRGAPPQERPPKTTTH